SCFVSTHRNSPAIPHGWPETAHRTGPDLCRASYNRSRAAPTRTLRSHRPAHSEIVARIDPRHHGPPDPRFAPGHEILRGDLAGFERIGSANAPGPRDRNSRLSAKALGRSPPIRRTSRLQQLRHLTR